MRSFAWSCVLSSTSALVLSSLPAIAGTFSVGGTNYEVNSIFGTWDDVSAKVEASPWWGDLDLALNFAQTVQFAEGAFTVEYCNVDIPSVRTPCHPLFQGFYGPEFSPFFATRQGIIESPPQIIDYSSVEYFVGGIWATHWFPERQPQNEAVRRLRTNDGSQHWAYAVEVEDPQDVPEPATLVGLLGLAGVLLGVKRQK